MLLIFVDKQNKLKFFKYFFNLQNNHFLWLDLLKNYIFYHTCYLLGVKKYVSFLDISVSAGKISGCSELNIIGTVTNVNALLM